MGDRHAGEISSLDSLWDAPRGAGGSGCGEEHLGFTAQTAAPVTLIWINREKKRMNEHVCSL